MNAELKQIDWDDEFAGKATEESWNSFKQILENSIQKNVPVKKVDQTAMHKNPWNVKYLEETKHGSYIVLYQRELITASTKY